MTLFAFFKTIEFLRKSMGPKTLYTFSSHIPSGLLLLFLFIQDPVLAQEPLQTHNLGIPADVCSCSDEERNRFDEAVSLALEKAKSKYNQDNEQVDEQALIENAMKNSGITSVDYEKLANMSEAQQQAYAMQMAQQAMQNAHSTDGQNQKELMAQYQKAQSNYNDANTIQARLLPIAIERTKLEKEAEAWYQEKIAPLYEKLNSLYGQAHWNMLHKIDQEKRRYCATFSPRNINLINQEVTALKELYPVMMDIIERNSFEEVNMDLSATPETDPVIMYLNVIGKAFEYRIHDDLPPDMGL